MLPIVFVCALSAAQLPCVQVSGVVMVDEYRGVLHTNARNWYFTGPAALWVEQVSDNPRTIAIYVKEDADGDVLFRESAEIPCPTYITAAGAP